MRLRILSDDAANGGAAIGGAANKDAPAADGHATNGHAANGHAANGHAANGHAANGHAANGRMTNGVATNGHAANGVATNGHGANGVATKNGAATSGYSANGTGKKALDIKKDRSPSRRARTNGAVTVEAAVRLTGLSKSFGRTAILRDINLSVAPGELIEVTGPSGVGKTTLLRLIHGQLRPNGGEVWVRGAGLHRWWRRGLGRIRRDVAFVFQEHHLVPRLTAFENMTLALQMTDPQLPFKTIKQRALETLQTLGLVHRRN